MSSATPFGITKNPEVIIASIKFYEIFYLVYILLILLHKSQSNLQLPNLLSLFSAYIFAPQSLTKSIQA